MLLTVTLSVKMMKRLRIMMRCEKWKRVKRIENRVELRYKVIKVSEDVKEKRDLNREVEKLLREKLLDFEKNNKAIIYCLQWEWIEELMEYLNEKWRDEIYRIYHANMNLIKRKEIYSKWKNENIMMIAAINALEMRINHEKIKLMIYHEYIWNIINFY